MTLKIDADRHFKDLNNRLRETLEGINTLYAKEDDTVKRIIELAVEWYESDNINYYAFFDRAFPTTIGPQHYYEGLRSFLTNLRDDSYYMVRWEQYEDGTYVPGKPWESSPYVEWTSDGLDDPQEMLNAMLYMVKQDQEREEFDKQGR